MDEDRARASMLFAVEHVIANRFQQSKDEHATGTRRLNRTSTDDRPHHCRATIRRLASVDLEANGNVRSLVESCSKRTLNVTWPIDLSIDDDVRNVNTFRREFTSHRLNQCAQCKFRCSKTAEISSTTKTSGGAREQNSASPIVNHRCQNLDDNTPSDVRFVHRSFVGHLLTGHECADDARVQCLL
jgi:hypothetical protein